MFTKFYILQFSEQTFNIKIILFFDTNNITVIKNFTNFVCKHPLALNSVRMD